MSTTAVVCDDHSRGTDELTIPSHVIVDDHEANRFGFIFKAFPLYFTAKHCVPRSMHEPFVLCRRIVPAFRDGRWLDPWLHREGRGGDAQWTWRPCWNCAKIKPQTP